jgi:SLT domain-containing protein
MASQQVLVKNFYRTILSASYIAGAAAVGGPPAAAAAAAAIASPVGVASIELAAQQATDFTIGSKAMATGGLITEPTFALLGEAGPEMVIPLKKKTRSQKQRANDKKKSRAWREANAALRNKNGQLKKGRTQKDVARRANKILKKL